MMYLPAKAQLLLFAWCHKVGPHQSWVLTICLPPEAHYDFEECSVFGCQHQPKYKLYAELVTSLTYNTVLRSLHVRPHTAMHLYMADLSRQIGTCTAHTWLTTTLVSFPGCNLGMRMTNLILGKPTPADKPLQELLDYRLLNLGSLAFYARVSQTARLWVVKFSKT